MTDEDQRVSFECTDCDVRWKSTDRTSPCWACGNQTATNELAVLYIKTSSEPSAPVDEETLCYPYGVFY